MSKNRRFARGRGQDKRKMTDEAENLETALGKSVHLIDGLGGWIDVEITRPPLVQDQDYSENVWGYEANDKRILVVSFFMDSDGWHWANAYGNVWGESEFDDDYDIKYWQPIVIPMMPNVEVEALAEGKSPRTTSSASG